MGINDVTIHAPGMWDNENSEALPGWFAIDREKEGGIIVYTCDDLLAIQIREMMLGYVRLPKFGCGVALDGETLMSATMAREGFLFINDAGEVTAPTSQEFLDAVNAVLGTVYVMGDFPGR